MGFISKYFHNTYFEIKQNLLLYSNAPISTLFLNVLIALDILLISSTFISNHYFGMDVSTSLTFLADDGWCEKGTQSVGVHCFGDYSIMGSVFSTPNPWDFTVGTAWNYPASGMIPALIPHEIGTLFGRYKLGLAIFLLASFISLVIPAIWASRGKPLWIKLLYISAIGFLSIPGLMVLDRGNSIVFAIPILLIFISGFINRNPKFLLFSVVTLTLLKPQFIILIFAFVLLKQWKAFFGAVFGIGILSVGSFLIWSNNFPQNIIQSISNTLQYGSGRSLSELFPSNATLLKFPYAIEVSLRKIFGKNVENSWIDSHQSLAALFILIFVLFSLWICRKFIREVYTAISLVVLASLISPTSWSYYLVFAIPIAAIILRSPIAGLSETNVHGEFDRINQTKSNVLYSLNLFIVVATGLTLSRLLLPLAIPKTQLLWGSVELASSAWFITLIGIILYGFQQRFTAKIQLQNSR